MSIAEPIAQTDLIEVDGTGLRRPIHISIGRPRRDAAAGTWVCPTLVVGDDNKFRDTYGEDALQALSLALRAVRTHLQDALDRGHRLIYPADGSEFPIDAYFP